MIYIIIAALVTILILYFYTKNKSNKSTVKKRKKEQEKSTPIDILLDLNILIRLRIFNMDTINYTETIIDKLRNIIPILTEEYSKNELTWIVNKMASTYLAKVLYPYSKLSEEQQVVKEDSLLKSLKSIEDELDEIILMVNKKDESQFDKKAKFINHRFSDKF